MDGISREEWSNICFNVAKNHPEYLKDTFEAFSAGVKAQADYNYDKVAKIGAALSMLYQFPKEEQWRKLARERLIESKLFLGTPFERELEKENIK
jgi:hypothetical protein